MEEHVEPKPASHMLSNAAAVAQVESGTEDEAETSSSTASSSQDPLEEDALGGGLVVPTPQSPSRGQPHGARLQGGETVSEMDDAGETPEPPEEDAFLFRHMGRKFKSKLSKFTQAHFSTSKSTMDVTKTVSRGSALIERLDDFSSLLWSAFRVPAYKMERDEYGRRGVPIVLALLRVRISESRAPHKRGLYSPNTAYAVELSYGDMHWTTHRRVYDFFRLHSILVFRIFQGVLNAKLPDFPGQLSYILDAAGMRHHGKVARRETRQKAFEERRCALEEYFCRLLRAVNMQAHTNEVFEFLECSALTLSLIPQEAGGKRKEGYLKSKIIEIQRPPQLLSCSAFCRIPAHKPYRTKWFVVRSSYIALIDRVDQAFPSDVILCDKKFHMIVENENSSQLLKPQTLSICNSSRKLKVRPESNSQMHFWIEEFRKLMLECVYCRANRFGSFAPVRTGCRIEWLIDGEEYYTALVKAIREAKEEIYLHGWWISPELYLMRPSSAYPQMRLDRLLQEKARSGVKIYIMVFKEFSMALSLNSQHTKTWLEKLHPNIRVQRHPDHLGGILYWAHHEKLAVIDQSLAFTGGLDLCFGRYDTQAHHILDFYPNDPHKQIWSGLDYANPRIRDFRNVTQHMEALVDRKMIPRMPWHDVHAAVYGSAARDLARHFIERWNYVKQIKAMHKETHIPFLLPKPDFTETQLRTAGYSGTARLQATRSIGEWSMGMEPETSIYDAYLHYIENSRHFIYVENQFFISRSSEMQATPIRNRIAQAIVERIIRAHMESSPFKAIIFLPLMPAFEAAVNRAEASSLRMIMQAQYSAISRGPHSILGQLATRGIKADEYISFYSLRTFDFLEHKPITEQLYIHSKLLIVDDLVAIMGSANINDRSMLGVRDSEIAMIVEDDHLIPATLNGQSTQVARAVRALRVRLFQEHLGLLHLPFTDPQVEMLNDPTADEFYNGTLRKQASLNTQIYREIFHCVPDDCVDTWEEYRRFTETPRAHVVDDELGINSFERLDAIKGSVVLFPTQFLKCEDLVASLLTPEYLLPVEVYL